MITTSLTRYEAARIALAEAHRVDEVKDIRDKAEAMAAYARQAKDHDLILWATEIKVRAERRAGELLAELPKGGKFLGRDELGDFRKSVGAKTEALEQLGITKDQSARWQQLASMSDDHFEAAVATAKDTAGQVTTAFMLREAEKARPRHTHKRRLTQADKHRLQALNEARGTSPIIAYARTLLRHIKAADALSPDECETLEALHAAILEELTEWKLQS